jgi:hypothetical protein
MTTTKTAATYIKASDEITVKGVRMVVAAIWYEGRYTKPTSQRMTNMVGFEPVGGGEIVWVAAHVKVTKH